jgi:hypothetical protein
MAMAPQQARVLTVPALAGCPAAAQGQLHALQLESAQRADKAAHGAAARGDITY